MKRYGFNPAISKIDVFNKTISLGYGTHRLAYLVKNDYQYVPIYFMPYRKDKVFDRLEYKYTKEEYEEFLKLRDKYFPRVKNYKVCGLCLISDVDKIKAECESYGIYERVGRKIYKYSNLPANIFDLETKRLLRKLDGKEIEVFTLKLSKQRMIYKHGKIKSVYMDKLNSRISNYGYISNTLIESDILEVIIN